MEKASNLLILRVLLLIILLVIFFFLFFLQVFEQYTEKLTNTAKIAEKVETIAVPTFTICTGWKESIMDKYNVGPTIFYFPPGNNTNLPINKNIRDLFDETTYALSEDFSISISANLAKPKPLKVGRNEIKEKGIIQSFQVKENPTYGIGMCYVIIPDQLLIRPFHTLTISIARNLTDGNDEISKLFIQISSNDTFNTINFKTSTIVNEVMEEEFVSNDTYMNIDYKLESTEFIKDCTESSFFKCWAEQIAETKEFNCTKKCVPVVFRSIMEDFDHDIPVCFDNSEEYCMLGIEGYKKIQILISTCLKQCENKASRLDINKVKSKPIYKQGQVQLDIYFKVSPEKITYKEYLIYDAVGMFGSIGGSLGLFVGFSIFDSICPILEFLLKKLNFI